MRTYKIKRTLQSTTATLINESQNIKKVTFLEELRKILIGVSKEMLETIYTKPL